MMTLNDLVVTAVSASYRSRSTAGARRRTDRRPHWALVLKTEGSTVYRAGGETVRSDAAHPVILPAGLDYEWECRETGDFLMVEFDATVKDDRIWSFSVPDTAGLVRRFSQIERCEALHPDTAALMRRRYLYGMLALLAEAGENGYLPSERRELLRPAMAYLAEHYADPTLDNDRLAALCGISTVYFRKLFRTACGMSPMHYLQQLRMAKAKEMLAGEYSSVGEVAASVGYRSIYHFSKMFRETTGMAPTTYAARSR